MSQSEQQNRRILLASRPHGEPTADNFRLETGRYRNPPPARYFYAPSICRLIPTCAAV
ncbi:NADPH-dependent curcumin reductase [Serratia plymuthica]|nr:NADPH-dependent curcumin reductase [Serratia plymuthica]